MSVEMVGNDQDWERLLHAWAELDRPDKGWRAEILEGEITLTPSPAIGHHQIADRVHRALLGVLGDEWAIIQGLGVAIPTIARLYEPDLSVLPVTSLADPERKTAPPAEIRMVVEIVSRSNAGTDRVEKLWGYAHAGVPLYLLIDRFDADGPSTTSFSEPAEGHYRRHLKVPFGKPVELPEPIGLTLETSDFSRR